MTDRTRSPQISPLSLLYLREAEIESGIENANLMLDAYNAELREVRAAIKRACGDRETQI